MPSSSNSSLEATKSKSIPLSDTAHLLAICSSTKKIRLGTGFKFQQTRGGGFQKKGHRFKVMVLREETGFKLGDTKTNTKRLRAKEK